jgi:pimeloyl-ACP methyl ester carboxylesterase
MDLLLTANKALRHVLIARGVESTVKLVGGHPIHTYRVKGEGKGPPVVLLHGLGGSANGFYKTFHLLAEDFCEIWAPDLPGNGFSPLPAEGPLKLEDQVRLLITFFDDVVKTPVFLVGNSLGGAMSLFLAHEAPDRLKALGLVSPAGARVDPMRMKSLLDSFQISSTAQARALTRRLFHQAPLPLLLFSGQLKAMYGSPAVRSAISEVKPSDVVTEQMLQGLKMPTLLIWGQSEKVLPYESIEYFRAWLPKDAEIKEVKGFGHIPQMEKPKELVMLLKGFARRSGLI